MPFLITNHFTHLTSAMFPDSMVVQAFDSAHTKTTCTIKGALHPHFVEPVMVQCKKCPFSILCDEGNDNDEINPFFFSAVLGR